MMTLAEAYADWLLEADVFTYGKRSTRLASFGKYFAALPNEVKNRARIVFATWVKEGQPEARKRGVTSSVGWKMLAGPSKPYFQVNIGNRYRAICLSLPNAWAWEFIGTHEQANKYVQQLRRGK